MPNRDGAKTTLPDNTLVVVADGVGARFYRHSGSDDRSSLISETEFKPSRLNDDGPSGKRPPESSLQETDEATFAKQLAHELYRRAHKHDFPGLVLIADPQTLGQIRPVLHKEVTDLLLVDIDRTFTNASTHEIQQALRARLG